MVKITPNRILLTPMSLTADITKSIKKPHRQLHSFDIYQKLLVNQCSRTHMSQELPQMTAVNVHFTSDCKK